MIEKVLTAIQQLLVDGALYTIQVVVPGIEAGNALDANDAIGEMFFVPAPKVGAIKYIKLIDRDDDTLALTAHVFSRRFTWAASDAAFTIAPADMLNWITSVTFDNALDLIQGKVYRKEAVSPLGDAYEAPEGGFWVQCSTTGTPNIAAGAMPVLEFGILVGHAA